MKTFELADGVGGAASLSKLLGAILIKAVAHATRQTHSSLRSHLSRT